MSLAEPLFKGTVSQKFRSMLYRLDSVDSAEGWHWQIIRY